MTGVEAYGLGLALAIGVAGAMSARGLWLAASVMLLEWAACNGAVAASGRLDPAEAFAFIHFLCAACLLRDERATAEVAIGAVYLALFVIDGGYLIRVWASGSASIANYLNWTAGGGWAQIAALAAGGLANGPGKRWFAPPDRPWPVGIWAGLAGVALAAGMAEAAAR